MEKKVNDLLKRTLSSKGMLISIYLVELLRVLDLGRFQRSQPVQNGALIIGMVH